MGKCEKTECWAHVDWHCEHAGLVRVFGGEDKFKLDGYCYALPFVVSERFECRDEKGRLGFVEFIGMCSPVKKCQMKAGVNALQIEGWGVIMTRIKDGVCRECELARKFWK